MRLGSIDIGSSSLHLWVVDLVDGRRETVHLGRAGLRLVRRWAADGPCLDQAASARALAALAGMVAHCAGLGCDHVRISATSAVRAARDHQVFCNQVRELSGVPVRVLTGEQEAAISFLGVVDRLDCSGGPALVFDLGGGSTELVLGDRGGAQWLTSLPVGHLRGTQAVAPLPDPPLTETTAQLRSWLDPQLEAALAPLSSHTWDKLFGISGTVWTLSRVLEAHQARPLPQERAAPRVDRAELESLRLRLEHLPRAKLADLPGMDRRRSDSFYAGVVVVEALLEALGRDTLWTAEGGVREGLVADFEREHLA